MGGLIPMCNLACHQLSAFSNRQLSPTMADSIHFCLAVQAVWCTSTCSPIENHHMLVSQDGRIAMYGTMS